MRKVGIFGGTRFLGRRVLDDLAATPGIAVSVFNRGVSLPAKQLPRGVSFFRGDRENSADVYAYLNSDCGPFDAIVDFSGYTKQHFEAFNNFPDAELAHRIRSYLFISTSSVYALPPPIPVAESGSIVGPANDYGFGKIQCEQILQGHANRSGMRAAALRVAGVFGPGTTTDVSIILEALLSAVPLVNSARLLSRLSFIFPADLSGLVLAWIGQLKNSDADDRFSVWNFAQRDAVRAVDLIQVCANACGATVVWTDGEGHDLRSWPASDLVLDTDRLAQTALFAGLKFQPLSEIVRDVYVRLRRDRSFVTRIKKLALRKLAGVYVRCKHLLKAHV